MSNVKPNGSLTNRSQLVENTKDSLLSKSEHAIYQIIVKRLMFHATRTLRYLNVVTRMLASHVKAPIQMYITNESVKFATYAELLTQSHSRLWVTVYNYRHKLMPASATRCKGIAEAELV